MRITSFLILVYFFSCNSIDKSNSISLEIGDVHSTSTPNLWVGDSLLYLIYTSEKGDSTSLYLSTLFHDEIIYTSKVASGNDWFVNWADFSAIVIDPSNSKNILVHWLQKSAQGTYDYDIMISRSNDKGKSWSSPQILHSDGVSAEHGFVSFDNYNSDYYIASWLDGRNTKTKDPNGQHNSPMTLRTGLVHKHEHTIIEYELDDKVCDCCQTSIVSDGKSSLIGYRDRTDDEIRDIVVRSFDSLNNEVVFQSKDQWKINGCPVNGPALASNDKWSALAWYTAAVSAQVHLSYGLGHQFDQRLQIDLGNPLGRVDIELFDNKAYLSWLEVKEDWSEIVLGEVDLINHKIIEVRSIATTSSSRRSGFPIFKILNGSGYLAYTKVINADETQIRLEKISL